MAVSTPGAPTALWAECMPEGKIIGWTPPSDDGGSDITDYAIDYSSDVGETWATTGGVHHHVVPSNRGRLVPELVDGTAYLAKVAAVNAVGRGEFSENLEFVAVPVDFNPGIPDCPTALSARLPPVSMSVEFVTDNAIVRWEQQPQLSEEFNYVQFDRLYPLGNAFMYAVPTYFEGALHVLVDGAPYRRELLWTSATDDEPLVVNRDVSAENGVIFRVCNSYGSSPNDFECISQTFDINTSQNVDRRAPVIDLVEVTPTSIDPGDVVAVTMRLRDISGINDNSFTARFSQMGDDADLSVSLTEDGDETIAVLQATWPAWEFGCVESELSIGVSDSAGNSTAFPYHWIDVSCAAPSFVPPGPPTGLTATTGVNEVALSWTPPTIVDGRAVTDYIVEYSTDGTTWTTFSDGESSTASGTVTGLAHSTAYTFRVSAVNATGTGTASATTSATTASVPGAPGCISFNEGVAGANLLRWGRYVAGCSSSDDAGEEDHAGLGGSAISAYIIEYSSDAGATWLTFESVSQSPFLNNNVGGVLLGQEDGVYLLRVSAVNAVGTGPPSATLSVEWPQPLSIP